MTIKAFGLPALTASRTWDAPSFVLERVLQGGIDRIMIIVALVREAAGRGEVVCVAELLIGNAVLKAVDLGFGWGSDRAINSLANAIDGDAGFRVAGGIGGDARGWFEGFGCGGEVCGWTSAVWETAGAGSYC